MVHLDTDEFQLLTNERLFITRQSLTNKLYALFAECSDEIAETLQSHRTFLPNEVLEQAPKISRGENYLGLPWTMLDYPRFFSRSDVFAVRNLCWWGRGFSFTLHLSGSYSERYVNSLAQNAVMLSEKDFHICVSSDQWQHHYLPDNYRLLYEFENPAETIMKFQRENGFIKLMKKLPLVQWKELPLFCRENSETIFAALR